MRVAWALAKLGARFVRGVRSPGSSLDQATRDYVRTELGFRMVKVTDGREALQVERLVQRGSLAAGRPFLNPR